jgi:GT2 family glycosyltransferase
VSVTAIIPMWNRAELTRQCVAALRQQTVAFDRILVVDDGSTEPFHGDDVLRLPENRGFAAAVNAGWRAATTTHIAVINNDVRLHPAWLEHLLAAGGWFATGKLFRPDGLLDGTFDLLSRGGFAWRAGHGRPDGGPWDTPREISMASFTAVLLRTELREQVGELNESFGSYYEDVEFGVRCRRAGLRGRYVPAATGRHEGSATAGAWSAFTVRQISTNHARLVAQHWGKSHRWAVVAAEFLWRVLARRRGHRAVFPVFPVRPAAPLACDDALIQALQQETGFDTFWRWYFRLVRP